MRTLYAANNTMGRIAYHQVNSFMSSRQAGDRAVVSAAVLAAVGIGLSSFSLKQMIKNAPRRY